jgi:ubiquinone biosynthesis protein
MQLRIVASYVWVLLRARVWELPYSPAQMSEIHRRNARRFKDTACRLKGANVKLGQIASMQAHLLPREVVEELRTLRDAVTASDPARVRAQIEHELGHPIAELFAEFDDEPIAAASMGQVHAARLMDGERVVVKVLHPGLEHTVAIDLAIVRATVRFFARFADAKIDLAQIVEEAQETLRLELDMLHEGEATDLFRKELAPLGILVPRVHWAQTAHRVLTLDFIDGTNIDDREQLDAWGVDREKLIERYLQSFVHQALRGGFFHADPHPGNCFCTPDGRLALLDFGMVKRLPDTVRIGLLKEILGGFFARPRLWADGMILKGAVAERERDKLIAFAEEAFVDPLARAMIFDHEVESQGDLRNVVGRFAGFLKSLETLQTPKDNVMFGRALGIIIDVMKEVVPEKTPSELAGPVMMPVLMELVQAHPEYLAEG